MERQAASAGLGAPGRSTARGSGVRPVSWHRRRSAVEHIARRYVAPMVQRPDGPVLDVGHLLHGRRRHQAAGRVSANGTCHLLECADGWAAVQLARPDDVSAVDAVVGHHVDGRPWDALRAAAHDLPAAALVARCRLVEIPAAAVGEVDAGKGVMTRVVGAPRRRQGPIVDLSSMWAGPLAARLLSATLGSPVVNLESTERPDPMRRRADHYMTWVHAGRRLVSFDHTTAVGRATMHDVVDRASIVVTSGRRRSMSSLGLEPEAWAERTGGVWLHISGFGLSSDLADVVAFGDDAAVAGGLVHQGDDGPVFVGDALADPLSGMAGAAAAFEAYVRGGGRVVDVALAGVAADVAADVTASLG